MGFLFDDPPHWEFTINEVSARVYRLRATREGGINGEGTGLDADALLDDFKKWARKVEDKLAQRRR
jgi:hypothetical protein